MKKFFLSMMALTLSFFVLFGCSNDVDNSSSFLSQLIKAQNVSVQTASLVVSTNPGDSRSTYVADIKSVIVTVKGYDAVGKKFEKTSGKVDVSGGAGSSVTVSQIPLCNNAVVEVQAYSDSGAASKIDGVKISAITDIKASGNSVTVTWESSKKGNVYAALLSAGVNTNVLTSEQISSIEKAIPADTHASLINAAAIAAAYSSLGDASSYKMTAGAVKVTCYEYDGKTLQLSDPSSAVATASTSGAVTISNAAPGTWTLYVLDGTTVKTSKSVVVTGGETATVTIGQAVITDKIIVHAKGYKGIYIYDTTGITTNSYDMTSEGNDWYTYTLNVTRAKLIFKTTKDSWDGQTGNLTRTAGEWWFIGDSGSKPTGTWYNKNPDIPPEPTLPSVSISPVDGSKIALNGSISVAFDNGNDTITSAKVTVNGTEFDMGTTAGTWSKSLSELGITSEGATVTVSAIVKNSVGTGTASASLTTKAASKLVTNPNELRIYQVMVASFQDGDPSIGYSQMWGPDGALKGGDLQGIINALDYISELGCNALWMTPIFQSNTGDEKLKATGYFANDYFNVDNHFGTNEKFAELVGACHERGIAVILDGVFGHNAGTQLVASPTRNGIKNPGITPSTSNPVDYAGNEDSLKYYSDVARYWITEYKIDGWRFDQCYQVGLGDKDNNSGKFPVNTGAGGHNYWYDIRKVIEEAAASNGTKGVDWGTLGYMVGEHWHGDQTVIQMGSVNAGYTSSSYGDMSKAASGYGLNGCFDFPSYYKVIQGFAQEWGGTTTGNITTGLSYLYKTYSEKGYSCKDDDGTYDVYYPNFMLSNHDLYRIGDLIKKKFSCEYDSEEYTKRNKVLLAAQCAYSGPITIYYGDEIGDHSVDLSGWGGDNVARSSGKITGFNTREQTIHDWTQKCLAARADHEALWNGTNTQINGESDFYVAKKQGGGETIYIAFNYNKSSSKSFSASGTDLLTGATYSGTVTVPALSAVYVLAK
jgi:glycosidase